MAVCLAILVVDRGSIVVLKESASVPPEMVVAAPPMGDLLALESFQSLLPRADLGEANAQCEAGKRLARGTDDVAADPIEGSKWLDLCIRHPDVARERGEEARDLLDDLINIAGWDIVGEGKYRAFHWQQGKLNADHGEAADAPEEVLRDLSNMSADEAFMLGADLNAGRSLPVDFEKALRAFKHAAGFGMKEALFNVGLAHYVGKGIKADPVAARRWLDKAADAGSAGAAKLLGVMAVLGHGMEMDRDVALSYLKRAADLGDPEAAAIHEAVAAGITLK